MASPLEHMKSPLKSVIGYLPEGHDKALKQAFYNTATSLFALIVCLGVFAVYHILEAFLKPLLWALLCGTCLHPFKHKLTYYVTTWLKTLRKSGTPLLIGTAFLPLKTLDIVAEKLVSLVMQKWKTIFLVFSAYVLLYFMNSLVPWKILYNVVTFCFEVVYYFLNYFSAIWVWTLAVAYTVTVIFWWTPQTSPFLKFLSVPVWLTVLFHLASATGPFRVPIFLAVFIFLVIGLASDVADLNNKYPAENESSAIKNYFWRVLSGMNFTITPNSDDDVANNDDNEDSKVTECNVTAKKNIRFMSDSVIPEKEVVPGGPQENTEHPENSAISCTQSVPSTSYSEGSDNKSPGSKRPDNLNVDTSKTDDESTEGKQSDQYFIMLFYAIIVVQLWHNLIWCILLLPLLICFILLKKFGIYVSSSQTVKSYGEALYKKLSEDSRLEVILPKPIQGLGKLIIRGDGKMVSALEKSMDIFISVLVILLVLVGTVLISMFMVIQFQRESMHLVSVSSNVLNKSFHPELKGWLPNNETMQQTIDSVVGNAYKYGRVYISDKAKEILGDNNPEVEEQVLHVYDQVYQKYFVRKVTGKGGAVPFGPHVDHREKGALQRQKSFLDVDFTNVSTVWNMVKKAQAFDLHFTGLWSFVQEYSGAFMQIVESIWLVLRSNFTLFMNILTAIISAILKGGTAILNFVVGSVIFLTTLYYLLVASKDTYLPVEWFKLLMPPSSSQSSASSFGDTVEKAISSVFVASFKMSAFYGIYTWLTHTLFNVHVVYVPAALAALLATIPLLGTYWAALPAVIELWLVNGEGVKAILLFVAHLLPMSLVDTAIYSDIQGAHPFMTGLAIAGGLYWLGLEGAIFGPIVLCCLMVAVNVFSSTMKSVESSQEISNPVALGRRLAMKSVSIRRQCSCDPSAALMLELR